MATSGRQSVCRGIHFHISGCLRGISPAFGELAGVEIDGHPASCGSCDLYLSASFCFPCAGRDLVTDLKQVKRSIWRYIESPCLPKDSVATSESSLCPRLEETVSFPGRSERLVCSGSTAKSKPFAFVRPIPPPPTPESSGINPAFQRYTYDRRGLFCQSRFFYLYRYGPHDFKVFVFKAVLLRRVKARDHDDRTPV